MLLKLLFIGLWCFLKCIYYWEFLYQNRIFDILLSSHHMWNIVLWSLGPWKASTTASQGEVPRRWGQVSEQLLLLDIFQCKEDIPSKGNGCPVAMYFIFQGPNLDLCFFGYPKKPGRQRFLWRNLALSFFSSFFFAETIQLSFPLKQLGIRLKAPGCTDTPWENRLEAARLVRWCEFPSALSLLYCKLLHLFRQKLRPIQFSIRHRGMHKSTFESHMIFMPSVVWDLWKVKQVPKIP